MSDFRIIDDSARTKVRNPEYEAMERGQTVFVPLNGEVPSKVANRIRTAFKARGRKSAHTRIREIDGERGVIAWLDEVPA